MSSEKVKEIIHLQILLAIIFLGANNSLLKTSQMQ